MSGPSPTAGPLAAAASSDTSHAAAAPRPRGVQFVEEPEVKVHAVTETNAEGEGIKRLLGRRDEQGNELSSDEEEDDFDPNDAEDVLPHP